ncbi:hypothetical protein [Mycobacterium sp. E796]|uniref:hypothetical protein n=1 Tax=Mycobacterium sp. E796 TaxID=1834151 RepID=UPI0012EA2B98|nr:hypothetical protein [Mycobacterium sp. E796]
MRFAVAIVSSPSHHDIGGEALNEVAEALHHALLAHGHDSVLTNRFHLDDRRTIVLGANLPVQYGLEPPKSPIFYNLEQGGPCRDRLVTTPVPCVHTCNSPGQTPLLHDFADTCVPQYGKVMLFCEVAANITMPLKG